MAAESIFDFPFHRVADKWPESGTRVTLQGSYMFATPPDAPVQRIFLLKFPTMQRLLGTDNKPDVTTRPKENAGALMKFYQDHQLYKAFTYPHPWLGDITVFFNRPLELPEGIAGGNGWTGEFEVEFIENPV